VILEVDKPYFNHNGGTVAFGPDHYLYLAIGDGGNKNDIGMGHTPGLGNAQDLTKLLGKMLRLDVDAPSLEADQGVGNCPCEHIVTLDNKA